MRRRAEPLDETREPADPEDTFRTSELSGALQDALDELEEDYRVAVVLYDVLGCSYTEIAEFTDVAEGTVKSRIFRGRSRLAELLGTRTAEE
jgi:RNA polymerase sigma-70 factor (ECF subfamily)